MEKRFPFPPQRCNLFSSGAREAVVAAIASGTIGFPSPSNPTALFKRVEHGIERSEIKMQRSAGIFFDALGNFKAIELLFIEKGEDCQFGAAPGYFRSYAFGHDEYRIPVFLGFAQ